MLITESNTQNTRDVLSTLAAQIEHAQVVKADELLGFPSWTAYLADTFKGLSIGLPRGERRELVAVLAASGMSTRAIAPIAGVDQATVTRDLQRDATAPPDPHPQPSAPVTGLDGKTYPKPKPATRRANTTSRGCKMRYALHVARSGVLEEGHNRGWHPERWLARTQHQEGPAKADHREHRLSVSARHISGHRLRGCQTPGRWAVTREALQPPPSHSTDPAGRCPWGSPKDTIMNRFEQLMAQADAILKSAKGRDLTMSEVKKLEDLHADALEAKDAMEGSQKSRDMVAAMLGGKDTDHDEHGGITRGGSGSYTKAVNDKLAYVANTFGVKALLTGQVETPPAVPVAALPDVPSTFLDMLPKVPQNSGNTFSYLRQVTRDNNAAVVADNQLKPTIIYTFTEVEDRCRVVAHLSEPFPLRYLSDHDTLTRVLDTEMVRGVNQALEAQVLAGDGTGENFQGILSTTGVRQIAFQTDMVTNIRKAATAAQVLGVQPTGWVFSAADAEALDLLRENGATGGFLLGAGTVDRLLKVPAVVSTALPAGTALLGDWRTVANRVRETASTLAATQAGDLFDKNQVKLRAEGRYGLEVRQPVSLSVVDLTA